MVYDKDICVCMRIAMIIIPRKFTLLTSATTVRGTIDSFF